MLTIIGTPMFMAEAARIWTDDERLEFPAWIAGDPEAGTVILGSGGCRKVGRSRPGAGKQGGTRVIYFNRLRAGQLWMLLVYPKTVRDNIPGRILRQIRREPEDVSCGVEQRCAQRRRLGRQAAAVRARD